MLNELLSCFVTQIQRVFSFFHEEVGPTTKEHERFIYIVEMMQLQRFFKRNLYLFPGRPQSARISIARAFIAMKVFRISTTVSLIDRLRCDKVLRQLCGYESARDIPSESTFSRALNEFAKSELPSRIHDALVKEACAERIIGHISRDSTAIEAREKPIKKEKKKKEKKKRGRPPKGEERPKEECRLQKQIKNQLSLDEMINDLPKVCDAGTKRNSNGHQETWIGYKFHLDVIDGDIPISAVLTSASLHDSQVAIPLAKMSATKVTSLYDLMDSAYDAQEIHDYCKLLGHVPIIDVNPRRDKSLAEELRAAEKCKRLLNFQPAEDIRYNQRSASERVNARLKDDFGADKIRVKGHKKIFCHLMFSVVALAAEQILRLVM